MRSKTAMKDNALAIELWAIRKKWILRGLLVSLIGIVLAAGFVIYEPKLFSLAVYGAGLWTFLSVWDHAGMYAASAKPRRLSSGLRGENAVYDAASKLDSCVVRNQVLLPNARSRTGHTEADFIIIGKKALYLIETKNNSGRVAVNDKGKEWKVTLAGGQKTTMRNPVRQVKIQAKVLRERLNEMGVSVAIKPAVAFPNIDARLFMTGPVSTPVFTYPLDNMTDWIQEQEEESSAPVIDQARMQGILDRLHSIAQHQSKLTSSKKGAY